MNRTFKYALSAVLGVVMIAPAMAQSNFPDVPETHWAYKELATLKANGLLVGYPDGLFRGGRPASRYEMAVAIHAAWANLKGITDGLKTQIDELLSKMENAPSKADVDNLRTALEALQGEVNRIKSEDIAGLRRLVDEFGSELKALGANVDVMKKDIADLQERVGKLEKSKLPIDISGDVNLFVLGGYSAKRGETGVTVDGRPVGVGRGSYAGASVGVTRDLTVLHEAALKLTSNNETGPKFTATIVTGNMFGGAPLGGGGTAFGNQSNTAAGAPFAEGPQDIYIQEFAVMFNTSLAGLAFNAEVGRIGYMVSPYMFKRPDNTPYFANDRWDNGKWMIDGALLQFNFGNTKVDLVGGRANTQVTSSGTNIQSLRAGAVGPRFTPGGVGGVRPTGLAGGAFPVDQMLGIRVNTPITESGSLNLAYLWLDSNTVVNLDLSGRGRRVLHNGVDVYGADLAFDFSGIKLTASYAKSDIRYNTSRTVDTKNSAFDLGLAYDRENFGIHAHYRNIEPRFAAPGDWGRIGAWWNPTDIEGFTVKGYYDLNEALRLNVGGDFYKGSGDLVSQGGLRTSDKIDRFTIGLDYKFGGNYLLSLGYEDVTWKLANRAGFRAGADPKERWFNLGLGMSLDDRTKLNFLWQVSDYDGKGVAGFGNRARGGLLSTQLSVKF